MNDKHRTITVQKGEAALIYRKHAFALDQIIPVPENIPNAKEINGWTTATANYARQRASEVQFGLQDSVTIEMLYEYPRDVINFRNRLAGDAEE